MNQTEVIRPKIECNGGLQVRQLAGECQRQAMKPCNLHSDRQILPLHIGCTHLTVIRNAKDLRDLGSRHARRRIPTGSSIFSRVELGDFGIGGTIPKTLTNGGTIRSPGIGTDLRRAFNASAQIGNESMGIDRVTFADMKGRNELRFVVQAM